MGNRGLRRGGILEMKIVKIVNFGKISLESRISSRGAGSAWHDPWKAVEDAEASHF